MTRLTTALLITAFAGTASAGDIYNGFARGNPDLYPHNLSGGGSRYGAVASQRIGSQPGVGDIGMSSRSQASGWVRYYQAEPFRHYHEWAKGNGDLYPESFTGTRPQGYLRTGMQPGVGDTGMGSRDYVDAAPLSEDKPFTPTVETFGQ